VPFDQAFRAWPRNDLCPAREVLSWLASRSRSPRHQREAMLIRWPARWDRPQGSHPGACAPDRSAPGPPGGTKTQSPSCGTRPPTRFSTTSPHIASELTTQDTRACLPNGGGIRPCLQPGSQRCSSRRYARYVALLAPCEPGAAAPSVLTALWEMYPSIHLGSGVAVERGSASADLGGAAPRCNGGNGRKVASGGRGC